MSYSFTFKGVNCSQHGVRLLRYTVKSPNLREYEDEVAGLPGVIDFGTELGKREIEVVIDIDPDDRSFKLRQSAILTWLKPTAAVGILSFSDVPGRIYFAKLTGNLSAEQIGNYGEIRLTFKCTDPYAYGPEMTPEEVVTSSPFSLPIVSAGSEPTPPVITLTNTGSSTIGTFRLVNEFEIE